jgi:hypothetical protein
VTIGVTILLFENFDLKLLGESFPAWLLRGMEWAFLEYTKKSQNKGVKPKIEGKEEHTRGILTRQQRI